MTSPFSWLKSNAQAIAAGSAVVISVAALFVAWDQARVMRAQQHADVWPALQIQTEFVTSAEGYIMSFTVKNDGIGPAIVEHVAAGLGGEVLDNWEQLGDGRPDGLERPGMWTGRLRGEILAPGEETILANLTWPRDGTDRSLVREFRGRLWDVSVEVCYCSVYGRCWTTDRDPAVIQPEPVAACPAADPQSNL